MSSPSASVPDYHELQRALLEAESVSAAEAHGIVAGVLCAPEPSAAALAKTVLADMRPDVESQTIERLLGMLRVGTQMQLAQRESDFSLLMPDENQPLAERVEALTDFCRGYLMGLVAGGAHDFTTLPVDAREVVDDLIQIAEAEMGELSGESGEQALVELLEYVRVGVQVVYEDMHPVE